MVTINKQLISLEILAVIVGMFGPNNSSNNLQHRPHARSTFIYVFISYIICWLAIMQPGFTEILKKNHLLHKKILLSNHLILFNWSHVHNVIIPFFRSCMLFMLNFIYPSCVFVDTISSIMFWEASDCFDNLPFLIISSSVSAALGFKRELSQEISNRET